MDIGHFYSPAIEPRSQTNDKPKAKPKEKPKNESCASRVSTRRVMVDNKGWRKKIGGKPKELPLIKTGSDDSSAALLPETTSAIDSTDRRRHGWRKTIAVSRPVTPMTPAPSTPTPDDVDDIWSKRSDSSTPRRDSKPKLIRYTSLFTTHKEEPAGPHFSGPWDIDGPPAHEPWAQVDPIVVMESIHSHLCKNRQVPVPLEYSAGLFHIFDSYRKLQSYKDHLEASEQENKEHLHKITSQWLESEERYEAEIHRLELLIARGTAGMTGLVKARQGTVVDRRRRHRRAISTDRVISRYQHMSLFDVDQNIKPKSQQVLLQRPMSPSEKMTALSRHLTYQELPSASIGTPSGPNRESTLSRKVKSELVLMDLRHAETERFSTNVVTSSPLGMTAYTETMVTSEADFLVENVLECDAFIALKELGALIARRKGLDVSRFVHALTALLTPGCVHDTNYEEAVHQVEMHSPTTRDDQKALARDETPKPPFQELRSKSDQRLGWKCRRHFSFEPGDDQVKELEDKLKAYDSLSQIDSTESDTSSSASQSFAGSSHKGDDSTPLLSSLSKDFTRPSMIPSPVQSAGRIRRENSASSLQPVMAHSAQDDRHSPRTSIQTAFRETLNTNVSTKSRSRSNSSYRLPPAESPLGSEERLDSLTSRHSAAALTAARVAEAKSNRMSENNTRLSTTTPSSYILHTAGQSKRGKRQSQNAQE